MQMRLHIPHDMASIELGKEIFVIIHHLHTRAEHGILEQSSIQHDRCHCTFSASTWKRGQIPWESTEMELMLDHCEKNTGRKMKTYDRAEFLKLCEGQLKNSPVHANTATCRSFNGFCK